MPQSYKLHIISVSGIQWKPDLLSLHREKPNVYVEISVGGKKLYHTSVKRSWEGMWNDISSLSVDTESAKLEIGFQVFHKPTVGKHKCLAKTTRELSVLLKECSVKGDFQLELDHADDNLTQASKPELVVSISPAKGLADAAGPLAKATENSATLHTGSAGTLVGSAVDLVDQGAQHDDLLSALGTLVARLGNVVDIGVKIGGEIAKIHPYSDAAWKILTSAVKKQKEADQKTVQLVQAMTDVFSFAEDVEKLSEMLKRPRLETSISALVQLTEECAKFIEGYCKTTFWTRVTTEIWKQRSQKIDDFCTAFSKFHQDFDKGVQLHTAFVTTDLTISS
ncbi:hypothetical protein K438DRAFT_1747202 [Mycena galopus ATCC 62051]|nr:hypothetical protein K438DRAFT_1747202 [Mycena galopus ATCC 62051]